MSGMTTAQRLVEFARAYEENDKPTPPVWLNRAEMLELMQDVELAWGAVAPVGHGDLIGTYYGIRLFFDSQDGRPTPVAMLVPHSFVPEVWADEILSRYQQGTALSKLLKR